MGSESLLLYFVLKSTPAPGKTGSVSTQRTAESQVASREEAADKIRTVHSDVEPRGCLLLGRKVVEAFSLLPCARQVNSDFKHRGRNLPILGRYHYDHCGLSDKD